MIMWEYYHIIIYLAWGQGKVSHLLTNIAPVCDMLFVLLYFEISTGKCLAMLLVVQALAVVVIVILKRFHDDSMHKEHPPGPKFTTVLHYLKYPLLLWSLQFNRNKVSEETAKKNEYVPEKPKMHEVRVIFHLPQESKYLQEEKLAF